MYCHDKPQFYDRSKHPTMIPKAISKYVQRSVYAVDKFPITPPVKSKYEAP